MKIENIQSQFIIHHKLHDSSQTAKQDFAKTVQQQSLATGKNTLENNKPSFNKPSLSAHTIELGTVNEKHSSVAQLLLANPNLKAKTWSIIHDAINQDKAFNQIPSGTRIYYNNETRELSWPGSPARTASAVASAESQLSKIMPALKSTPLVLGQLNGQNPTVSDLLAKHQNLADQRWAIIHADVNKDKPFNRIPAGSRVSLLPDTKEIVWSAPEKKVTDALSQNNIPASTPKQLDEALKPYLGTPYKDLDCYTLVVNGLQDMGVRYRGQDSLSRHLLQMAKAEGKTDNTYFTGEGLTEALGQKVYSKSLTKIDNIDQQTEHIFKEIQALMKKGDILSFSLESKGHTGVISQNNDQWTYINSGRLDNSLINNAPKHGVGEENLVKEINNWIKLAQKKQESLIITIGRIDELKFV
jgi:hypothetical protein